MKVQCPLCGKVYDESLAFCMQDGVQLVPVSSAVPSPEPSGDVWVASPPPPLPAPSIPDYKLFDANSVGLATLLGSPIAGSILMALNYRRLKKPEWGASAAVLGLLLTGLLVVAGYFIPQSASAGISIGVIFAMRAMARTVQGCDIEEHVREGGRKGSAWAAAGIGFSVSLLAGVIIFYLFVVRNTKITVGSRDEVYYSGSATKQDATALGESLKTIGYFKDRGVAVLLSKEATGTVVSFIVKDGIWNQPSMVYGFEEVGRELAPSLGGFPITVRLANAERKTERQMFIGEVDAGSKHEVYYFGAATESDGRALADALTKNDFFTDNGATVMLNKDGDRPAIAFVVRDGTWDNPRDVEYFEHLVREVAPSVGGLPVMLRLLDTKTNSHKEVLVN